MSKLRPVKVLFLTLALICCWIVPASAQPTDFVSLAERLKPAVVNISTAKTVTSRSPSFPPFLARDLPVVAVLSMNSSVVSLTRCQKSSIRQAR